MAQKTNEQKAKEIQSKDPCQVWIGGCPNVYAAAMEMAKWKDEEHNECKKDILTLVTLIPCNEENESIINDIKNLLK